MDSQIILLPRDRYWDWVRASREYVLRYGVNLTPDPHTAGRYMQPRQIITFPSMAGAYPVHGDLEAWFQAFYPGVRLDAIAASSPAALHEEFRLRIEDEDRYGENRRPFALQWPTDYAVITQPFGVNPDIYARWGLPGHEGVDLRALSGTKIYCCADGEVFETYNSPNTHPYGNHVRVRHRDGYRTIYAHLQEMFVEVGDVLSKGQVLGLADSTGNSTGSHLHLTLKRDGATERGETYFPRDIIDPTPYLIWPEGAASKVTCMALLEEQRCLVGAHGRVGEPLAESDLALVEDARLEALKIHWSETGATIGRLKSMNPSLLLMARLGEDFSTEPISAERFVASMTPQVKRLNALGVEYFEVHTNPNLQMEGWGRSWNSGADFGAWFHAVVSDLKRACPEALFGFPGLSTGPSATGWRQNYLEFLAGAEATIGIADWIGVNCYWTNSVEMSSPVGGRLFEEYRRLFPHQKLSITEFYNPSPSVSDERKAWEYKEFLRTLRNETGVVAAFAFAISAPSGYDNVVWRRNGDANKLAELIGTRDF
jgi:hypothetical protein